MSVDMDREETQSVEEKLQGWLGQAGFNVEKQCDGNATFSFWVTQKGSPSFSVYQPRDKRDLIYVESGVIFSGVEKEVHSVMVDHGNSLSWELKSRLLCNGFAYKIELPDLESKRPGGIIFAKTIYFDGLSKDRVLETACQTVNTVRVLALTIQRYVGRQTADEGDKDHSSSYVA